MKGELLPLQGGAKDGWVRDALEALERAISINHSLIPDNTESNPLLAMANTYTTHPSSKDSEKIFSEKFDHRKSSPALYSKSIQESEDVILKKLDDLLLRAEHEGLDADEMKETADLLKKVR